MTDGMTHGVLLTGSVAWSVAAVGCFVAWCVVVYAYREYMVANFGVLQGGTATEKLLDNQNKLFGHCLNWAVLLGILTAGLACLRYGERGAPTDLPPWAAAAAIAAMWVAVAAVWGWQWLILKIAGGLTLRREFTDRLLRLRKIVAATTASTILPVFLLFAMTDGTAGQALGWIVVAMGGVFSFFLAARTFVLFTNNKFSILLWFLYLCAVEIFPWSTAAIMAGKLL
jgi:hypothetical protein